jgi:uncharacterized protein (DUF362 family)
MRNKISRRTFTAFAVAASVVPKSLADELLKPEKRPDIVSVHGENIESNIASALSELGGMSAFVKPGHTVSLLSNTIGRVPGAFTDPEVIRTVARLCKEAGAKEVKWTDWRDHRRLRENKLIGLTEGEDFIYEHTENSDDGAWKTIEIPGGRALKSVRVFKTLWDADVSIAMPVIKHHGATGFSGCLKLMMGTTNQYDNREKFHGSGKLEDCIAELNTACRRADLYIVDAMKSITTGGPVGPGRIVENKKIVVGCDPVALDTYASQLIGADPAESRQLSVANSLGVGQNDLTKLVIKERAI